MNTVAVLLPTDLVSAASRCADVNLCSVAQQIEHWALLGRCAEDNPDLPLAFIKECLLAQEEAEEKNLLEFQFRGVEE